MPKVRRRSSSVSRHSHDRCRASPYHPCISEDAERDKLSRPLESAENVQDWENVRCPICMGHPHNAVLIKCSSHDRGCRPFICNTSDQHSNCLDQFCKYCVNTALTKLAELPLPRTTSRSSIEEEDKSFSGETSPYPTCPLCRGNIYGYSVVHSARRFMDRKVRSCSLATCEFSGSHSELGEHVKFEHPNVRPSEVDPNRKLYLKVIIELFERMLSRLERTVHT